MPTTPKPTRTSAGVHTRTGVQDPTSVSSSVSSTSSTSSTLATDTATVARRAAALLRDAEVALHEEQETLADLHHQQQALDERLAQDAAAIATARTRLAAMPEGLERAKLSRAVSEGTALEADATARLVALAAGRQRLVDLLSTWEATAEDRAATEADQRTRIGTALSETAERIAALQQQITRSRDAARQAKEQQGAAALATFRDELAALDEGIAQDTTRLTRRQQARAHLTSSIASRLQQWPALMQQAERAATPAAADPLPYRLLVAYDRFLSEVEAIQKAGGIPNSALVRASGELTEWSIAAALTQSDVFVLGVLADFNCGEGRLGTRSLGQRRSRVNTLLARERPRRGQPSPALPPLPLPLPLLPDDDEEAG